MTDPIFYVIVSMTGLAGVGVLSAAALRGWKDWIELKRLEIQQVREGATPPSAGSRIEIADLKERIRKLEAIAAGVDL